MDPFILRHPTGAFVYPSANWVLMAPMFDALPFCVMPVPAIRTSTQPVIESEIADYSPDIDYSAPAFLTGPGAETYYEDGLDNLYVEEPEPFDAYGPMTCRDPSLLMPDADPWLEPPLPSFSGGNRRNR